MLDGHCVSFCTESDAALRNTLTNKDLLYSTGNSTQYSVITQMGKEFENRMTICICITGSLCCTPETHTTL